MSYSHRIEIANDIPDDTGEPIEFTVRRLRDIIELQAQEITRLKAVVWQFEQTTVDVGYVYEFNESVRADGAYQE